MATKWNMETEYIQSCNCAYGCPCNFNALPTTGHCEAFVGYKVRKGTFGDTKLDGATFAACGATVALNHLADVIRARFDVREAGI